MQQIRDDIYVEIFPTFPSEIGCNCNPGFVVTSEGIVMIDTPSYYPTAAVRWRDEIAKKGEIRYLVNTEHHRDHTTGNYFFPGIAVSHQGLREDFAVTIGTPEDVRRRVEEMDPEGLPLIENYQLRPPTITFTERLNLYLGDYVFELMHLPGHTPYQVGVYIPQERVIFTGDNVVNGWRPGFMHCCPLEWLESLDKILALDVEKIVPGHGEISDKGVAREYRACIQESVDRVQLAIAQGMSKEEAADRVSFEGLLPAIHPGVEMHHRSVMRIYEMLTK